MPLDAVWQFYLGKRSAYSERPTKHMRRSITVEEGKSREQDNGYKGDLLVSSLGLNIMSRTTSSSFGI